MSEGISIQLGAAKMRAVLRIDANTAEDDVTSEACQGHAKSAGLPLNAAVLSAIDAAIATWKSNPAEAVQVTIAEGRPPEHGRNGRIEWVPEYHPSQPRTGENQPESDDESDAAVDFYAQSKYVTVRAGTQIATLYDPTPGVDGVTVLGATVAASDGKPLKLQTDDTVIIDGANRVVAARTGLIHYGERLLRILDCLMIEDYVDFHTGHIDFDGNVVVKKGVRDCFRLHCTGDLEVHGLIEAADIVVGGCASFSRGVSGREKATINVRDTLHVRYLNAVTGSIGRDLHVEREIVGCQLRVGRSLIMKHGHLVGGSTRVGQRAELDVIGSDAAVPTELIVGEVPALATAAHRLEAFREELEKRGGPVKQRFDQLAAQGARLSARQKEELCEVQFEMMEFQRNTKRIDEKRAEVLDRIHKYGKTDLIVNKRLHAKTILGLGGRRYYLRADLRGPLHFTLDERGEPVAIDLINKHSRDLTSIADVAIDFGDTHRAA